MERNIEKKEQTMSALKEKLKTQNEKWQDGLQSVERIKTNIALLEEKNTFLNCNLNEVNESEVSLKDLTNSLTDEAAKQNVSIQHENNKHTDAELLFEKETSLLSVRISTGYESYDRNSALEEFKNRFEGNTKIESELEELKAIIIQKNNNYSINKIDNDSREVINSLRELTSVKKKEYKHINQRCKNVKEEIRLLDEDHQRLQNDITEIEEKLKKLEGTSNK